MVRDRVGGAVFRPRTGAPTGDARTDSASERARERAREREREREKRETNRRRGEQPTCYGAFGRRGTRGPDLREPRRGRAPVAPQKSSRHHHDVRASTGPAADFYRRRRHGVNRKMAENGSQQGLPGMRRRKWHVFLGDGAPRFSCLSGPHRREGGLTMTAERLRILTKGARLDGRPEGGAFEDNATWLRFVDRLSSPVRK
jgi:hypothetical protein